MTMRRFCDFCGGEMDHDGGRRGRVDGTVHLDLVGETDTPSVAAKVAAAVEFTGGPLDICAGCVVGAVRLAAAGETVEAAGPIEAMEDNAA